MPVSVEEGTTILEAARQLNFKITYTLQSPGLNCCRKLQGMCS